MRLQDRKSKVDLNRILVATDFEILSMRALPFAVAFAERHGAKLLVAHIVPQLTYACYRPGSVDQVSREERDCAEFKLNQIIGSLQHEGRTCEALVEFGDPGKALIELADKHKIDLIVLGTSSRGGLGKLIVGSIAEEIIRKAPCPVLTVGPHVVTEPHAHFKSIVCAVDFSSASLRAVQTATTLAEEDLAYLTLVHVLEGQTSDVSPHDWHRQEKRLRDLLPAHSVLLPHRVKVIVDTGAVAEHILGVASEFPPDLIVMGALGVGAFAQTISHFGSIVHKTVSFATCPVLTVGTPNVPQDVRRN